LKDFWITEVMPMGKTSKIKSANGMPIGEKIKLLRTANSMTQAELGEIIWSSAAKISRVESSGETYKQQDLEYIKQHFGFLEMPLTDFECDAFKEGLYFWRELIIDRKLSEAREFGDKRSYATQFEPFDFDIAVLYRLFEALLLIYEGGFEAAEEKIDYLRGALGKMNDEYLCLHYINLGLLSIRRDGDYETALDFYKQAYELKENNESISTRIDEKLYIDMALCYTYLDYPNRALFFLNKTPKAYTEKRSEQFKTSLNVVLAGNYRKIGELKEAEKILSKCLLRVKGIGDENLIASALYEHGLLYKRLNNLEQAIECFDQTLGIKQANPSYHQWVLYHKIHCFIGMRNFAEAEKLIEQAKALYRTNKEHLIPFESISYFLTISNSITQFSEESVDYIEKVTIPYLIKQHDYFLAADYYAILEKHYKKTRKNMRSLIASKGIKDIYEKVFIQS